MANPSNPKINFTFPLRWLNDKEDRVYLGKNIQRQIIKYIGGSDNLEELESVLAYKIVIFCLANKPVSFKLTKQETEKMLKPIFPNAKCLSVDAEFAQHKSKTMLPLMDYRIYF